MTNLVFERDNMKCNLAEPEKLLPKQILFKAGSFS